MMTEDEENDRQTRIALIVGAVGAALAVFIGMLAPYDGALWRAPEVLRERVAVALSAAGYSGLEVQMHGQRAVLRGIVEDERDIAAAKHAAMTAAGGGGAWAGGVTSVDALNVRVGAFDRPYSWSARRERGRVILSGAAPSPNARAAISRAARDAFPTAQTVDEMHVAGGAASPQFLDMALEAVRLLAGLRSGEARIVDDQVVFIGDGNQRAVDAIGEAFADPPAPFHARIAVTIDGLDVDHPELQGLNLADTNARTCERAFHRLMERNIITFAPNSAAIDPSSRPVLDALASVALRCDRFSIEVAGHTDDQGARELNMELSRRRADAVAAYLAGQGVARSRLIARGYGPDRPRADNGSDTGQAMNRRIEFYVNG